MARRLHTDQCLIDISSQEIDARQAQIGIGLSQPVLKPERGSKRIGKQGCCPVKLLLLIDIDMGKAELSLNFTRHVIGRFVCLQRPSISRLGLREMPARTLYIGLATVSIGLMNSVTRFLEEVRRLSVVVRCLIEQTTLRGDMPQSKRGIPQPLRLPVCAIEALGLLVAGLSALKLAIVACFRTGIQKRLRLLQTSLSPVR